MKTQINKCKGNLLSTSVVTKKKNYKKSQASQNIQSRQLLRFRLSNRYHSMLRQILNPTKGKKVLTVEVSKPVRKQKLGKIKFRTSL